MTFVASLPDTEKWKQHFADMSKGNRKNYLNNQSGSGEVRKIVSPMAQDLGIAKSRIRKYKRRSTATKRHKASGRVKKRTTAKRTKKVRRRKSVKKKRKTYKRRK